MAWKPFPHHRPLWGNTTVCQWVPLIPDLWCGVWCFLNLRKFLNKWTWRRWIETPWRSCNVTVMQGVMIHGGSSPPTTPSRWIASQKASDAEFCCYLEQTVEQRIDLPVIWDTMGLMWCDCTGFFCQGKAVITIRGWHFVTFDYRRLQYSEHWWLEQHFGQSHVSGRVYAIQCWRYRCPGSDSFYKHSHLTHVLF